MRQRHLRAIYLIDIERNQVDCQRVDCYAVQVRHDPFQIRRDFVQDEDQSEVALIQKILQRISECFSINRTFLILSLHRLKNRSMASVHEFQTQGAPFKTFHTKSL